VDVLKTIFICCVFANRLQHVMFSNLTYNIVYTSDEGGGVLIGVRRIRGVIIRTLDDEESVERCPVGAIPKKSGTACSAALNMPPPQRYVQFLELTRGYSSFATKISLDVNHWTL